MFAAFEEQTSVLPFKAILEVRRCGLQEHSVVVFWGVSNQTQSNATTSNNPNQNKTKFSTQGRQELPADYWKEFARLPYLIIGVGTLGAYLLHPFMQAGSWIVRG